MKVYEILTLLGLIVGPLSAVLITLWSQKTSAVRDRQLQTLRMLLNTRHLSADPAYTVAINMIPIEFNKQLRIMKAWESYIAIVRYRPTDENRDPHNQEVISKQTKMIFEILKHLGYNLSETDIQTSAYVAEGWTNRETLKLQSEVAWVRIADALEKQNAAAGLPAPRTLSDLISELLAPAGPQSPTSEPKDFV